MSDPWLQDVQLKSWDDYEAENTGGGDYADDELEPGSYQFAVVDRSPIFEDKYKPGNEKVKFTFAVVNSEDPADLGKRVSQWFTVTSHPMSELYPIFKAASGGHLDPGARPALADLKDKQIRASWAEKTYIIDGKVFNKMKLQTVMPAKQTFPVPPRSSSN